MNFVACIEMSLKIFRIPVYKIASKIQSKENTGKEKISKIEKIKK